jgi:acyl-CoA synthetase (AMP-forming)/AMP-acid ligase II
MIKLRDMLAHCASNFPLKVAYFCGDGERTWKQMHERSDRLAGALQGIGVGKGSVVSILGKESFEVYEHFFACMKLGAIRVGVNWRYAADEILHILRDSATRVLLVHAECISSISPIRDALEILGIRLVGYGGAHGLALDYEALLAQASIPPALPPVDVDDPLLYTYTSGTTGNPKGIIHTQGVVVKIIFQSLVGRGLAPDDIWYTSSASSWMTVVLNLQGLGNGMSHVIMNGAFDIAAFLRDIERRRVTAVMLVPTLMRRAIQESKERSYDLSSIRLLMYGSAPASPQLVRDAYKTFNCELVQSYGMSEGGWLTQLSAADHRYALAHEPALLNSVGRVGVMSEISIRDPEGQPVAPGITGEVWLRGETVMRGYLNLPNENAEVFRGEWICTNDIGHMDEHGYLYLTDRKKFMIITGAVNVFPSAVEAVLYEHPAVEEVAVVGAPHPEWGEAVVAVVKIKDGFAGTDLRELNAFCQSRLSKMECPKHFLSVDSLPHTVTGKVQKLKVKEWVRSDQVSLPWATSEEPAA